MPDLWGGTGSASRGLYRIHQFSKVEMFVICTPAQSEALLEELCGIEEEIYTELGLHFKILVTLPPPCTLRMWRCTCSKCKSILKAKENLHFHDGFSSLTSLLCADTLGRFPPPLFFFFSSFLPPFSVEKESSRLYCFLTEGLVHGGVLLKVKHARSPARYHTVTLGRTRRTPEVAVRSVTRIVPPHVRGLETEQRWPDWCAGMVPHW